MSVEKAKAWVVDANELIDGASFISAPRTRASMGLLHLSLEHNTGIVTLAEIGIWGSAFALFRSQFESFVRGVWFQWSATDEQVESFLKGNEPPRINELINGVNKIEGFDNGVIGRIKNALWKAMNDYTHGGAIQIKARNTETEIAVNYSKDHAQALLTYSVNLSYACSTQIARVCENEELANALMNLHKKLYGAES